MAADNTSALMSYFKGVCSNCGEPGHEKRKCTKTRACFICKMVTHQEESFPVKKKHHLLLDILEVLPQVLGFIMLTWLT